MRSVALICFSALAICNMPDGYATPQKSGFDDFVAVATAVVGFRTQYANTNALPGHLGKFLYRALEIGVYAPTAEVFPAEDVLDVFIRKRCAKGQSVEMRGACGAGEGANIYQHLDMVCFQA